MGRLADQRGQALPAVLAIMLLVSLLAGGLALATSAVLAQQRPNRGSLYNDLQAQNAVAAAAADVAGGQSVCGSPIASASPIPLFADEFTQDRLNQAPANWTGPNVPIDWQVTRDPSKGGSNVLMNQGNGASLITSQGASDALNKEFNKQTRWDYSVSAQLKPGSVNTTNDLEAFFDPKTGDHYSLVLIDTGRAGTTWSFERPGILLGSGTLANNNHPWHTLEIDALGSRVSAVIDGQQMTLSRPDRNRLATGGIAIRGAAGTAVDNVYVDVLRAVPTATAVPPRPAAAFAPSTTLPSLPRDFYCQRLDRLDLDQVAEQRAGLTAVAGSPNTRSAGCLNVPGGGQHLDIWFSVPNPSSFRVALVPNPRCPPPSSPINAAANCTNSSATPFSGLTMVALDCTTGDSDAYSYEVQLTAIGQQSWPAQVDLRSGPLDGDGSVYMTAAPTGASGSSGYEQADFLVHPGSLVLSFEAQLK